MTLITHIKTAAPKTDPTSQYSHLGLEKQPPAIQPTKASFQAMLFLFPYSRGIDQGASQVTAVIRLPSSLSLSRAGCPGQPPGLAWEPPSPLPLRESHCKSGRETRPFPGLSATSAGGTATPRPTAAARAPRARSLLKDTFSRRGLPPALAATEPGAASPSGRPRRRVARPIAAASAPAPAPTAPVGPASEAEPVQGVVAALPEGEPGARVRVRARRHPRRRRVGAERVLRPVPAVAVHVSRVGRGLVPRAREGPPGGGHGAAPVEPGGRPAPRVRPATAAATAATEAAGRLGAAAVGPEAVVVIVADLAILQLPFLLRGEPAGVGRGRRLRGRHGPTTTVSARPAPPPPARADSRETTPRPGGDRAAMRKKELARGNAPIAEYSG